MEDSKKRALRLRPHSNTISGGRPPNIDIPTSRPAPLRRNSDGSPSFPPPISVSEPTPVEPTSENMFKATNNNSSNNNLLGSSKKSRSRASSNGSSDMRENSTVQKVASKIRSRQSMEESDYPDNISSVAVSLAGTSGIYLANGKRNQDFHALFRSVPEDDNLIDDYGCALQKEILLQGRIYISENHICFNANIFGWVTNLVIAFADIIEIEKKSTAYFIPNAIQISTDSAKHFLASFLSRDITYDLMVDIWRLARPDLAPPRSDKFTQNAEAESLSTTEEESEYDYDSDTEDSFSDEDDSDSFEPKKPAPRDDPKKPTIPAIKNLDPNRRRAMSEAIKPNFSSGELSNQKTAAIKPAPEGGAAKDSEAKPQLQEKTECECGTNGEHYPNVVFDQTYSGTMDKFYDLLFKSDFMSKFLTENQKTTDLEMGDWKKGEGKTELVRDYSYIKPLNGAIGPKSTKCFIKEEIFNQDTQKFVSSLATTSTPDVPSGGSFTCKTRTCLTWAGKGKVRMLVTVLVDFTKSSWLKSTIEKASIDGQQTFYKDLDAAFQSYFRQHPDEFGGNKTRRKRREKRSKPQTSAATHHKPDTKPKSAIHHILGTISNRVADGIVSIVNVLSSPRAAHLTLVCLIFMVCINVFIAQRMSYVEQQLLELSRVIPKRGIPDETTIHIVPPSAQQQGEEDALWNWLGHLDNTAATNEKVPVVKNQDIVWDDAMKLTKQAKDRLDQHMIELSSMIQKAEHSLEDITSAVQDQRNKIRQH